MKFIQRVAWTATVVTYFLIALGGTVLATDSGVSCPDWPLCYGQAYYSGTYHVFLEQFHRFTAATVSVLVVLLVIGIIAWARQDRVLLTMAIAAPILLAIQIVLGGLTVLWKLPPQIITAHLAAALAIFAIVITMAVLSGKPARRGDGLSSPEHPAKTRKFAQLAISNALLVYILMLFGSYVTGSQAGLACLGWPLCTPASWAVSNHLADINILHRVFAVFVGLVMLWTVISALRRWRVARAQAIVGLVGGVLFVCQAIVGGLIVLLKEPAFVAGLHLALATAVWGTLVLLAALATNQLRAAPVAPRFIEGVAPTRGLSAQHGNCDHDCEDCQRRTQVCRNDLRRQLPENRQPSQHNLDRQQHRSSNRHREQRTIFTCPRDNPDQQQHDQDADSRGSEAMELLKKHLICTRVICLAVAKRPIRTAQAGVGGENCTPERDQKIGNYSRCPCYAAYKLHKKTPHSITVAAVAIAAFQPLVRSLHC